MKRLITFFQNKCGRSVMTLLLLFATSVCWADGIIHIWDADLNKDVIDLTLDYNGTSTGTKSFTMQANKKYGFVFRDVANGTTTEYRLSGSMDICPDNKYKLLKDDGNSGYIKSEISGNCTFTVQWDGSTPYLTVSYKVKDKLRYKLKDTDIYAYADLTYDNKIGITNINLYDDNTYEFQISDGSGNWYGNTETITGNCQKSFYQNTSACNIQTSIQGSNPYSYSRVYTFQTDWTDGDMKVSVTYQPISEYYLIVPDANVGNTPRAISGGWVPEGHKAFKMVGGRERNKEIVNPGLATVTLKIDGNKGRQLRYDSKDQIKFYIYDKTKNMYYQPDDKDYANAVTERENASDDNKRFEYVDGTNVELIPRYRTSNGRDAIGRSHDDIKDRKQDKYYYIKKGSAKYNLDGVDYPTMSLTFMFTQYNAEKNYYNKDQTLDGHYQHGNCIYYVDENGNRVRGNAKLLVAFLKTRAYNPGTNTCAKYYTEHINKAGSNTSAGVYLVGDMGGDGYRSGANTTNPTGEVNGEKYYDKNKYRMTPNYWYNGVIDNSRTDIANADSIVYSCEIKKGDATWDNFFLSFTTGDVLGTSDMWKPLLRPRVQNKMDAQALEGGVFYYLSNPKDGYDADQAQALNPLLTEAQKARYGSYRVYFNATYSTYRIAFHDGFYIGGPAVNNIADNNDTGNHFESNFRKDMTFVEAYNGIPAHYMYKGNFKKGSTFAFFLNKETYIDNYSEDGDDTKNQFVINNDKDMWNTQAPTEANEGADYPFFNKVLFNNTGNNDTKSLGTGKKAIKWTLPDGEYTLRFYNHAENGGVNPFYTIDKTIKMKNVTSTFANAEGEEATAHNYGGWRTFSDDCAMWVPNDVEAYYISSINAQKQVVLTPVPNNYIPAHCGVVLYYKNLTEDAELSLKPYSILDEGNNAQYTKKLGVTNLLEDCYDKAVGLKQYADGKYSYILTYKYQKGNGVSGEVPLNFWKSLSTVTVSKNSSYMKVPEYINPAAFNEDTKNYIFASNSDANSRSHCFILPFEDFDDSYVVTGITSIDNDSSNSGDNNVWYTIQGIKVASPVMPGLYIHNGKKIIIK
mgnify:FL=1